jgi:pyruvate dehydrogenase E2 component (dihydrolipoamide acetyltransferase)
MALQRVPAANAVWAEDRLLRFRHSDIGVAVALEGGLLTPIIRQADTKSLTAISAEMKGLGARARDRKLKPHEYQGGSTAISNLGMYGIREFSAIINPPHATILAVGAAQRRLVETDDGSVRFVSQMTVTLACDHRVVDGALGAELLAAFKAFIEQPVTMLV